MRYISTIIVAGGIGSRTNLNIPKQFYRLDDKTVLYHAVKPFSNSPAVDEIIIVTLDEYIGLCNEELCGLSKIKKITVGGKTRQQSVFNGLNEVDRRCGLVVVHDAARPFVTENEIEKTINAANGCAAAVGVAVSDTIKLVNHEGYVESTPERGLLRAMQTPQAVPYQIIKAAYEKAAKEGFAATDDVSLAEFLGCPVKIVEGTYNNFKITNDNDLLLAKKLFEQCT